MIELLSTDRYYGGDGAVNYSLLPNYNIADIFWDINQVLILCT